MKLRPLGKTGMQVSEIGFGAWAIGGGMWGKTNDPVSHDALRRALDLGCNFVDTAAVYGDGHSEQLVGKIHRERGGKFYVATKVPPKDFNWPPVKNCPVKKAFPAKWVREQTENSLRHLGMDCVDLQQIHVWSPNWVHETEWVETLQRLRDEGKIRFIGVSVNDHAPAQALELARSGLADTIQVIHNVFDQSPEDELFPLCLEKEVGILARVPLDEGSLTGKFTYDTTFAKGDWRKDYFPADVLRETVDRVEKLKPLIAREAPSLAVGALKYCLSQPAVSTVIPGIRSPEQALANCSASDGKLLSPQLLKDLKKHRWVRSG